jgi:hypothetical protein
LKFKFAYIITFNTNALLQRKKYVSFVAHDTMMHDSIKNLHILRKIP